jgi:hypothetical protein
MSTGEEWFNDEDVVPEDIAAEIGEVYDDRAWLEGFEVIEDGGEFDEDGVERESVALMWLKDKDDHEEF